MPEILLCLKQDEWNRLMKSIAVIIKKVDDAKNLTKSDAQSAIDRLDKVSADLEKVRQFLDVGTPSTPMQEGPVRPTLIADVC